MTRAVYLIETMPDYLRDSHRAAGNWGVYPHNGAERRIVDESELPDESDEYDHIVALASERDIARYGADEEPDHEARLQRAAAHLGATDLGGDQWAHYADETGRYYVVSASDLESLCDYLDDDTYSRDAYSHWCAGTTSEEQPRGWEPGDEVAS